METKIYCEGELNAIFVQEADADYYLSEMEDRFPDVKWTKD